MGMFDYVDFECVCPRCRGKITGFQTKDGDCSMATVHPSTLTNFYTSCDNCGAWIEYNRKPKTRHWLKDFEVTVEKRKQA